MACGGSAAQRSGRTGLNRLCFASWKCLCLGTRPGAWRWRFSFCFYSGLPPVSWIQNTQKAAPRSKERNRTRAENVCAFGPCFSQRDFSCIKYACLENDLLFDKVSSCRACRTKWRHRTRGCPSLLRRNMSALCCRSWLRSLLLDSDNDWHLYTVSHSLCTFVFSSFSHHFGPRFGFCSNRWSSHLCQWIFEFIAHLI